ncbi:Ig-like domain-containing protein [Phenylobacterium sp. LjRoot225]|uniref:Ig-like domain-containing protein n=1 Tax=Phenylobacterium sp. LjRoot225 TaxID=3342285 RepID=UPI003ED00FE3
MSIGPTSPSGLTDAAIVNGYVNNVRDTASQKLTGLADAGVTVRVYNGATQLGTATADESGAWSFTLGRLADGPYKLTATAVDAEGHVSAASEVLSFKVDTRPPSKPGTLADAAISKGCVNAEHNTASQAFTGKTDAGATVTVYDGEIQLGTVKAGGDGTWSFTLGQLSEGAHKLTASATDIVGNTSDRSDILAFTVDTHAPGAPSGLADAKIIGGYVNAAHNTAAQALTGKAEAYSFVSVYDGATKLGAVQASGTGVWSYTLGKLAGGDHSLTATATDKAGNISPTSSALAFTVAASPHPATISGTLVANQMVTFNDFPPQSAPPFIGDVPDGYAGFHWGSRGDLNYSETSSVGGDISVYNLNDRLAISRADGSSFGIVSLDIVSDSRYGSDGASAAYITGYRHGIAVYSTSVELLNYSEDPDHVVPTTVQTLNLNFENIDSLVIYAGGLNPHGNPYLLDNLNFVLNGPGVTTGTDSGSVGEDGALKARGLLTVTDPDSGEAHFKAPTSAALHGTYGDFAFADGAWSYTLNNDATNVQALGRDQVVHDTLTVTSLDGSATRTIDVSIIGVAEPITPNHVVTFDDLPSVAVGDSIPQGYAGFNWVGLEYFEEESTPIKNQYDASQDADFELSNTAFYSSSLTIARENGSSFSISSLKIADGSMPNDMVLGNVDIIGIKAGSPDIVTHVLMQDYDQTVTLNYADIDELVIERTGTGRWFEPALGKFTIDDLGFSY